MEKETKYLINEVFADNGEHSHWNLIDKETGENLWSESPEEDEATGHPVKVPDYLVKCECGCSVPEKFTVDDAGGGHVCMPCHLELLKDDDYAGRTPAGEVTEHPSEHDFKVAAESNYEPFGEEWRKEMMKFNKSQLIDMLAHSMSGKFVFTPDNLLDNIQRLGAWSSYGLASEALQHYFPEEYENDKSVSVQREVELLEKIDCTFWSDVVIKYHKEIGYKNLRPDYVNEH